MRQGVKESQIIESIVTGASTDFHDVLTLKEVEEHVQRNTYMFGDGRPLAKSMGR